MTNGPLRRDGCRGIFSAILTPLTKKETLDEKCFAQLAHKLLAEGQAGLYVAGGTGEGTALDDNVRIETFRIAASVAKTRGKGEAVIAHVGGVATSRALYMARAAAEAGCNAIAALPPFGGRYSYAELTDYYRALSEAESIPLLVYHMPGGTGYDFSRRQLSGWLELPNVLGMKFTSDDMFRMERLATLHPDKAIFNGMDEMLMHGLASGALGAIGLTFNLIGPLALRLYDAFQRADRETVLAAQGTLNHLVEAYFDHGGLRGFKAVAAEILGWPEVVSPAPGAIPGRDAYGSMKAAFAAILPCNDARREPDQPRVEGSLTGFAGTIATGSNHDVTLPKRSKRKLAGT
jgi:N-acetylneuraminate lyase